MFCLRSWIPILFFLFSNASPIYLILFLIATYTLNRPCVYCSLLLAVLVIALFDFRTDWFAVPETSNAGDAAAHALSNGTTSIHSKLEEGASVLAHALNTTAAAIVNASNPHSAQKTPARASWSMFGLQWVKNAASRASCALSV